MDICEVPLDNTRDVVDKAVWSLWTDRCCYLGKASQNCKHNPFTMLSQLEGGNPTKNSCHHVRHGIPKEFLSVFLFRGIPV